MLVNIVNLNREGIQIIWLLKMRLWEKLGYDVHIHTGLFSAQLGLAGTDVYEFNKNFTQLQQIPDVYGSKLSYIWYALKRNILLFKDYRKIKSQDYQVLYTLTSVLEFVLFPGLFRLLNPQVRWITVFDNTVPFKGPGSKIIRFLAWVFFQISLVVIKRADVVCAITPDLQKYLLNHGFRNDQVILTGCAVEAERIQSAHVIPEHIYDALFMGRINEKKGIYDMLEVLSRVVKKIPSFRLAIMGGGDPITVSAYKKSILEKGLGKNVVFLGYHAGSEKFNIIKSCRLFWFFSYDESFGVALLEAVCSGKFALVYDLPPFKYLYSEGQVIVCETGNFDDIADKTITLLSSGSLENTAGARLLDRFSWDKVVTLEYGAITQLS